MTLIYLLTNLIHMDNEMSRKVVAAEVRAAIARKGMRQTDICKATGFSSSRLSNKLQAKAPFTVDELFLIAGVLDVSTRTFFPERRLQVAA